MREFGHVLGCLHEHSSPVADIQWNLTNAYGYYLYNHKWDQKKVVLHLSEESAVDCSGFDPESILIYPIDRCLAINRIKVNLRMKLPERDERFIRHINPKYAVKEGANVF